MSVETLQAIGGGATCLMIVAALFAGPVLVRVVLRRERSKNVIAPKAKPR